MKCSKQIILASASPRRRELLAQIGIPYEIVVSTCEEVTEKRVPEFEEAEQILTENREKDNALLREKVDDPFREKDGNLFRAKEDVLSKEKAADLQDRKAREEALPDIFAAHVEELSALKAKDVYEQLMQGKAPLPSGKPVDRDRLLVIGADTMVAANGVMMGKPKDKAQALRMLCALQGRTHQVYTGVTLLWQEKGEKRSHSYSVCTDVEVAEMTRQEMEDYLALDDCMDKAGAYGIQNEFARYIKGVHGDYNNVVGLPVFRIYQELKRLFMIDF